jgi:hypothetical protein
MIKFAIGLLFLLNLSISSKAQTPGNVPGFLGKTNLIGAGVFTIPRGILQYNCRRSWDGEFHCLNAGKIGFATSPTLIWEKVLSRRACMNVSAETFMTGGTAVFDFQGEKSYVPTKIFMGGMSLGSRHFPFIRRGLVAPYGMYISTAFRFSIFNEQAIDPAVGSPFSPGERISNGTVFGFTLGTGRNFFLSRRLVLDLGFRSGLINLVVASNTVRRPQVPIKEDLKPYMVFQFGIRLWWLY